MIKLMKFEEQLEEIMKTVNDPGMTTYCVMLTRPGVHGWITQVEFTWFKPDTVANDQFHLAMMKWPEELELSEASLWMVACIPNEYAERASALLWQHGLKAAKPGYTFMVISAKGQEEFPIKGPRVYCLENHSKGGENVIYTNNPDKLKLAREHEAEFVRKYHAEHLKWLNTRAGRAEARAYWETHPGIAGKEPQFNPTD